MARRSETSLAALLLTQRLVDAGAPPLKAAEWWPLLELVGDPARLLRREVDVPGDLAARVERLLGAATAFAFALDEASSAGIRLVASVDAEYPSALRDRLGDGAPPLLYVAGDVGLLVRDPATVEVLAGGMARRLGDPATRRALTAGEACLCSPYPPAAVATEASAAGAARVAGALG